MYMYGCMALQRSEAGVLVLQGISNSRAIVHHLQHLQGLDKDDRWQFAVLYFCFVDIGSILNTFQGLVIHSFLLQKSPRCMSDTEKPLLSVCCHTCFYSCRKSAKSIQPQGLPRFSSPTLLPWILDMSNENRRVG